MRLDHIAIAVKDLDSAAGEYQQMLGVSDVEYEEVESEGVRVAILHLDNCRIELMEATGSGSPIARFVQKRGGGLHHMALQTKDIHAEADRMKKSGASFLGEIRPGSRGTKVTFLHPKSMQGVLTELCSPPQ